MIVHSYNPSYLESRDRRNTNLNVAQAKVRDTYLISQTTRQKNLGHDSHSTVFV
jgi:hypothetical protein